MNPPIANEMRHRIRIDAVEPPYDSRGIGTFVSTLATVWARISPQGGSAQNISQEERSSTESFEIWIRYLAGVTAHHQITWGSRKLVITEPPRDFDLRHKWLQIQAEEIVETAV